MSLGLAKVLIYEVAIVSLYDIFSLKLEQVYQLIDVSIIFIPITISTLETIWKVCLQL